MMHGMGDSRNPLTESAVLIEEVVKRQLFQLLHAACEIANKRNARFIGLEDFIFLLRNDRVKLRRLLRYVAIKDLKSTIDDEGEDLVKSKKKRNITREFLASIDDSLASLCDSGPFDAVKHDRDCRAEILTRTMSQEQYMDYSEAHQAGFVSKFRSQQWLMASNPGIEPKPTAMAIEVLAYLAFETVSQIVDLAHLVRQDQARSATSDPLASVPPPPCPSLDPPVRVEDSDLAQLSNGAVESSTTSLKNLAAGKKRKKSMRPLEDSSALHPRHIHEALRRYACSTGPYACFRKHTRMPATSRLLSL